MAEKIDFSPELAELNGKFGDDLDAVVKKVFEVFSLGEQEMLGPHAVLNPLFQKKDVVKALQFIWESIVVIRALFFAVIETHIPAEPHESKKHSLDPLELGFAQSNVIHFLSKKGDELCFLQYAEETLKEFPQVLPEGGENGKNAIDALLKNIKEFIHWIVNSKLYHADYGQASWGKTTREDSDVLKYYSTKIIAEKETIPIYRNIWRHVEFLEALVMKKFGNFEGAPPIIDAIEKIMNRKITTQEGFTQEFSKIIAFLEEKRAFFDESECIQIMETLKGIFSYMSLIRRLDELRVRPENLAAQVA